MSKKSDGKRQEKTGKNKKKLDKFDHKKKTFFVIQKRNKTQQNIF